MKNPRTMMAALALAALALPAAHAQVTTPGTTTDPNAVPSTTSPVAVPEDRRSVPEQDRGAVRGTAGPEAPASVQRESAAAAAEQRAAMAGLGLDSGTY